MSVLDSAIPQRVQRAFREATPEVYHFNFLGDVLARRSMPKLPRQVRDWQLRETT